MVRIYLDVETYRPEKQKSFIDEEVIAIGMLVDSTPYIQKSLATKVEPKLFTEWELESEEKVLKGFYENLFGIAEETEKPVIIVGFNILRMDIPLLIQKGIECEIGELDELNAFWHNTFTIDLFQQLLLSNKNMFRGLKLPRVLDVVRKELGKNNAPQVEEHGELVKDAYEKGEYRKIEEWLRQDLNAIRWLELSGVIPQLVELSIKKNKPLFREE